MPVTEAVDRAQQGEQLAAAVREAGALALSTFQKPLKSWTKGKSSPVTEADIAVDLLLRERLTADAPHYAWLSEESVDDPVRLAARVVWIVDPIDGTRAYIAGIPEWTVAAALVEDGRPIVGCVYAPAAEEFFFAIAGKGATLNGAAIATTRGVGLDEARVSGPETHGRTNGRHSAQSGSDAARSLARIADHPRRPGRPRHRHRRRQQPRLGPCGGRSFGARSRRRDDAVWRRNSIDNQPEPRHGALVAAGRARHATLIDLVADRRLALA